VAAHRKHLEQLALMQRQDPAEVTPAQAKYMKEFRDASVVCLSTEIEQGNVEYKYRLTGCVTNENRRHQLVRVLADSRVGQGLCKHSSQQRCRHGVCFQAVFCACQRCVHAVVRAQVCL
jgi:hypothetical protein